MLDDAQLAQMFLRKSLVDQPTLEKAQKMSAGEGISLYSALLENELVDEERAVVAVSKHLNLHCVSLREFEANPEILELVPFSMAQRLRLMPLGLTEEEGEFKLYVAMANPLDLDAIEKVGQQTQYPVTPLLAGPVDVDSAIERSYQAMGKISGLNEGLGDMLEGLFDGGGLEGLGEDKHSQKTSAKVKTLGGSAFSIDLDLDLSVGDKKPTKERHTRATLPSGMQIPEAALKATEDKGKASTKREKERPTLPAGTELPRAALLGRKGMGKEPFSSGRKGSNPGFDRKPTSPGTAAGPAVSLSALGDSASESSPGFGDWGFDDFEDPSEPAASESSMGRRPAPPSSTSRSENSSIRYVADPNPRRSQEAFPGNIPVSDLIWATVRLLVKKGLLTEDEVREEVKKKRSRSNKRR